MDKLKPCPFCGGEAELLIVPGKQTKWIIRCRKCFTNNGTFVSDHDEIETWNRRAMTNQEAIKILDNLKPGDYSNPYEKGEAIVMAIEALQAQDSPKPKAESVQNVQNEDLISRKTAIALADSLKDDLPDDERIADTVIAHNEGILEYQTKLSLLPSAQPEIDERTEEFAQNVPKEDLISRKAAIEAMGKAQWAKERLMELPSAQPTLCGYDIEHLILIANVLRKENLPPERITEALTDIGRIVSICTDEFEESLRKAVEQCKI